MKDFTIKSASIEVVVAKAKENNRHKKPAAPHRVTLKANAKTITIWLSCKRQGVASHGPVTIKVTVETDNLLIARLEAARAARGFGFADRDLLELDHTKHRC